MGVIDKLKRAGAGRESVYGVSFEAIPLALRRLERQQEAVRYA